MGLGSKYTPEEDQIITSMFKEGLQDKQIAAALGRPVFGITTHRRDKLNLKRRIRGHASISDELKTIDIMLMIPEEEKYVIKSILKKVYAKGKMEGFNESKKLYFLKLEAIEKQIKAG